MAKRIAKNANAEPSAAAGTGNRKAQRRRPPVAVERAFPWGVVSVSALVALALVGILVYAFTNQGSGFVTELKRADAGVPNVAVHKVAKRDHVKTPVTYAQTPPVGGPHNSTPQTCQVYTEPIANEHAMHSLEHGAVWITYKPGLSADELSELTDRARANAYRLLSPFPGQRTKVSVQAWGRQLQTDSVTDEGIDKFLEAYTSGPQAPERGAACTGTTDTGPLKAAAGAPAGSMPTSSP